MPASNNSTLAQIRQHIATAEQKLKKLTTTVRAAIDAQKAATLRGKIKP